MNIKLIIWIVTIFIGLIIIATVWYFVAVPKTVTQPSHSATTLPISGSVTSIPSTTSAASGDITVAGLNGNPVITKDFVHNGTTLPDKANPGQYLLAGNLGYCPSNPQQCQAASASDFTMYYDSTKQAFTIALTQEPIGQARLDAQQFMLTTLGITEQQMCSLNYYVGTTYWVNPTFDDRNLGFSFCPGATALPQ